MYIGSINIEIGDILNNGRSQSVEVLGEPFRDPSDRHYYCHVRHISGPYEGLVAHRYFIANRDGFMFVRIESKGKLITPKNKMKKFDFNTI